jgi:hypothetical protein
MKINLILGTAAIGVITGVLGFPLFTSNRIDIKNFLLLIGLVIVYVSIYNIITNKNNK